MAGGHRRNMQWIAFILWLFLLALNRRWLLDADLLPIGRLGDDEMLNMFAWEVEKLLEKLLNAVRVE